MTTTAACSPPSLHGACDMTTTNLAGDTRLDHVAIRVADRAATSRELRDRFDLRVLEETERFTLVGADEEWGKLTLLDANDERRPLPLRILSVALAVPHGAA